MLAGIVAVMSPPSPRLMFGWPVYPATRPNGPTTTKTVVTWSPGNGRPLVTTQLV